MIGFLPKDIAAFKSHFSFNKNQFLFGGKEKPTHLTLTKREELHGILVNDYKMPSEVSLSFAPINDWHPVEDKFKEIDFKGRILEVLFDNRVVIGWICEERTN